MEVLISGSGFFTQVESVQGRGQDDEGAEKVEEMILLVSDQIVKQYQEKKAAD